MLRPRNKAHATPWILTLLFFMQALPAARGESIALLVGINAYASDPQQPIESNYLDAVELKGCLNDVRLMADLLEKRYGFKPENIHTLLDEQATRAGILQAIDKYFYKGSQAGDTTLFFFAGQGTQLECGGNPGRRQPEGPAGRSHLPLRLRLGHRSCFPDKYIIDDDLGQMAFGLPGRSVLFILNCAHSASAFKSAGMKPGSARAHAAGGQAQDRYARLAEIPGAARQTPAPIGHAPPGGRARAGPRRGETGVAVRRWA